MLRWYANFSHLQPPQEDTSLASPLTLRDQAVGTPASDVPVVLGAERARQRTVITASLRSAVTVRYEAGESAVSIARELNLSKTAVLGIVRKAGVPVRFRRLSPDECAEICDLFRAGVSQVEIARKFGKDPGNIWHVLQRAGLVGRKV